MNDPVNTLAEKQPRNGLPVTGHGRIITATVLSAKAQKTATVFWDRRVYIPKFERYLKKRTKLQVHNPPQINAQPGDLVRIAQTRPLSKTKHFIIIERHSGAGARMTQDMAARERKKEKKAVSPDVAPEKEMAAPAKKTARH